MNSHQALPIQDENRVKGPLKPITKATARPLRAALVDVSNVAKHPDGRSSTAGKDKLGELGAPSRKRALRELDPHDVSRPSKGGVQQETRSRSREGRDMKELKGRVDDFGQEVHPKRTKLSEEADEVALSKENARFGKSSANFPDVASNPLMVDEYTHEIFSYALRLEERCRPKANYMDGQRELTWKMRGILNDWLIEIHGSFCLTPETLFMAVNIVDRFLSLRACSLSRLQLVGITALFIASKYEEVMCPSIQNFVYMTNGGYTQEEMLEAERYILRTLDYDLSFPSPYNFLRRISKADSFDYQTRTLGKYLLEVYMFEPSLLRYRLSEVAAAAMYLARRLLRRGPWSSELVDCSCGYEEARLKPIAYIMLQYHSRGIEHKAFFRKYANKRYLKASIFVHQLVRNRYSPSHNVDDEANSEPSSSLA
ncbi:G1/S-specific B-type cyclin Cig2 [Schizosaccharomyces japonicus yFS275]|uniref:G1/S-specific B-type cyclin Cig2 n=1 Tax=Schizosaccharomyces japonicus (strain yFS275 / FY16936) TaxID=402676 RepID=B6JXT7_SCHJY|nr:G1/S-specific B-type cyclin Cig2 [Schizosaccharomyces japonicus yFS275]EEB06355.1 G1/S-specific B-type cyclin Cig2 [Schizosaccharomyces japonicus yFS275]